MATHLDLEEQEQLDELKHFWNKWGNLITTVLMVAALTVAGYNGWQYWQARQGAQAATLYDEVDRAAQAGDATRVERAFSDIRDKFGGTTYAQQAALSAAKAMYEKGNVDGAKAALAWVAEKGSDKGLQAVARLRLAAVLMDTKAWDEALRQVDGTFPTEFTALAADRKGDILALQGKKPEAATAYGNAWKALDEADPYRRLVEVKLNALGVDPRPATPSTASTASPSAAPAAEVKP